MTPPSISLLIPCYNAASFLPRLMTSVEALTRPFSSILCYDDGSQDETVGVARNLGLEVIVGSRNCGVAHARNELTRAATTEWIHFHDADDLIDKRYLQVLSPFCDDHRDVVTCDADWIDESTKATIVPWRYDPAALESHAYSYLLTHPLGLNNSIIRRTVWDAVGGCDESLEMWEDADVHVRLARAGARWHHVPAVLTRSLRRSVSFSHDYRKNWICRLAALEAYAGHDSAVWMRQELASEAERAAAELAGLGDLTGARRALKLCRKMGGDPPTTNHPLVRVLKPFVAPERLLRWQSRYRRALANRAP